MGCAFLSLGYHFSAAYGGTAAMGKSVHFHTLRTEEDLFPIGTQEDGNGIYDTWTYFSYDHQPLKKEYDFNEDGNMDRTSEWRRIKNVTIETENRNSDKKIDAISFDFPLPESTSSYKYEFIDFNYDGYFDRFTVSASSRLLHRDIQEPVDTSLELLIRTLEKQGLQEDLQFVLWQSSIKHAELQTLLSKKEWQKLFQKIREYLDLPSNDVFPIELQLMTDAQIQKSRETIAKAKDLTYLLINPNAPKNIDEWLLAIDHEMLHLLQTQRAFEDLKAQEKKSPTWQQFVQHHSDRVNNVSRGFFYDLFKNPVSSSFYDTFVNVRRTHAIFDELEAHLYSYLRRPYYNLYILQERLTYSNKIFMRALYELIYDRDLSIPDTYAIVFSEVKKLLPILNRLPDEEVIKIKHHIREILSKKP